MIWVKTISIILGIICSLFFAVWIYRKKHFSLSLFFVVYSIILSKLLLPAGVNSSLTLDQLTWAIGPLLYLFVINTEQEDEKINYYHFIPFGIISILGLWVELSSNQNNVIIGLIFAPLIRAIHSIAYILLSAFEVKNNKWKKWLIVSVTLLLTFTYIHDLNFLAANITSSVLTLTIFLIGFLSIQFILNNQKEFPTIVKTVEEKKEDQLEQKQLEEIYSRILEAIINKQLYLNQNLKISDLNEEIRVSEKLISKAINTHAKENFNAFINRFRVKHATDLINSEKYSYYTIDAISEESGFSNKVSFYKAFKRIEAVSPSEYRQNSKTSSKQASKALP